MDLSLDSISVVILVTGIIVKTRVIWPLIGQFRGYWPLIGQFSGYWPLIGQCEWFSVSFKRRAHSCDEQTSSQVSIIVQIFTLCSRKNFLFLVIILILVVFINCWFSSSFCFGKFIARFKVCEGIRSNHSFWFWLFKDSSFFAWAVLSKIFILSRFQGRLLLLVRRGK